MFSFRHFKKKTSQLLLKEYSERLTLDGQDDVLVRFEWRDKKNLSLRVYPENLVVVRSPSHLSLERLRQFIVNNGAWIEKQLNRSEQPKPKKINWDGTISFLGSQLFLLQTFDRKQNGLICDGHLQIYCRTNVLEFDMASWLNKWYRFQSENFLVQRFALVKSGLASVANRSTQISLRRMKKRWGSCSRNGKITLNTALMICPVALIDFVIMHELAHLIEASHSQKFYKILQIWAPNWKSMKKQLNQEWSHALY